MIIASRFVLGYSWILKATLEEEWTEAQAAVQASSDVLFCREHGMNQWEVSAWYCWSMRIASDVIWPAATDQTEARECMEERGRKRQALPLERGECVFYWDSWCLQHTATPFCCMLGIQVRWSELQLSMCGVSLCKRGGWVLRGKTMVWLTQ